MDFIQKEYISHFIILKCDKKLIQMFSLSETGISKSARIVRLCGQSNNYEVITIGH